MRERGDLSACLNMDKLHYFFQPSVQSPPFFPIILCVNEVAWVMMEEEKNAPLLPLKKKRAVWVVGCGMRIEFMYVEKAFLVECLAAAFLRRRAGEIRKEEIPK